MCIWYLLSHITLSACAVFFLIAPRYFPKLILYSWNISVSYCCRVSLILEFGFEKIGFRRFKILVHYNDVIMSAMTSQIIGDSSVRSIVRSVQRKENIKAPRYGLCVVNSPVTGEFPTHKASYAENVSIWWRHHDTSLFYWLLRLYELPWKGTHPPLGREDWMFLPVQWSFCRRLDVLVYT